jgi:cytochrome c-type biogenesis protein CcmH/NrfG
MGLLQRCLTNQQAPFVQNYLSGVKKRLTVRGAAGERITMASREKTLEGYVKTSSMYLYIMVSVFIGFISGVLFSSYKSAGGIAARQPAMPGAVPMSQEQSQTLAALIQATETTPDNVNAWTQLGHFYFDSGQPQKAIGAYEKSLALDAGRADVWTDLGVMYRRSGDPKKAIECFDRALSINRSHEVALFNKGVVYMHDLKDTASALGSWELLVQINPSAKTPGGQTVKSMLDELRKQNPS